MEKPESVQPAIVPVVRVLRLRRRRTSVPWIYSLYHVDPKPRRRRGRESWEDFEAWDGLEGWAGLGGWEEFEEAEGFEAAGFEAGKRLAGEGLAGES